MTSGEHTPSLTPCDVADCRFPCGLDRLGSWPRHRSKLPGPLFKTDAWTLCPRPCGRFVPWGPHAAYRPMVSGSFHLPSEVLFSVRSHYYCTIGLGTYLGSEDCTSQLLARYPTHDTQDTSNLASLGCLRDFHPLRSAVPGTFGCQSQQVRRSTTPHLPTLAGRGFGLSSAAFDRLYSRHLG
jgi:hypothetical protein